MIWESMSATLSWDFLLSVGLCGFIVGCWGYPILFGRLLRRVTNGHTPVLVLVITTPPVVAFWATSVLFAIADGDPLWPRAVGRGIGMLWFLLCLAVGLASRYRWLKD